MQKFVVVLVVSAVIGAACAATDASWEEIAAKAVREAAEKAAREKSETEAVAKATAEAAAKAAAEATVKAAVEKAAKDAAVAAAKAAAEEAAKALTDEKAAKEAAAEAAKEAKAEAKEILRQIDTRVFHLIHASAAEVSEKLNEMWNGEFGQTWKVTKMAVPFPESNSIVVTAPRLILDACEKVVSGLDVEARQVYIEARFVQLGNTAAHRVGIDWEFLNGVRLTANANAGYQSYDLGNGVNNYKYDEGSGSVKKGATSYELRGFLDDAKTAASDANIGLFGGTLNVSQMAMTLSALDSSGDTKMFSNPKIIVSSGKKATVDMTTKYPNVKISAKRTTGVSDSLDIASEMVPIPGEDKMMFAKESFFSWGITLDVTPRIGTNDLINVSIVPTISDREDWVDTAEGTEKDSGSVSAKYPVIKVQRLVTEFNLSSGTTAVIGGLSMTDEVQQDTGIPVLRHIPWIGPRIFGWQERVKEQREIIVFVTVGIVDPHKVNPDAGLPKNAILGRQYTKGQKLEPGDKPEKNMEGFDSLDLRSMEDQAKDPLQTQRPAGFDLRDYIPFRKDQEIKK